MDRGEYMVDSENKSNQQETIVFIEYNEILQNYHRGGIGLGIRLMFHIQGNLLLS